MENIFKNSSKGVAKLKTVFRNPKPDPLNHEHKEMMWVQTWYEEIGAHIAKATAPLTKYLDTFKEYEAFIKLDVEEYVTNFYKSPRTRGEIEAEMKKHTEAMEKIQDVTQGGFPDEIWMGLYLVNCTSARNDLIKKRRHIMTLIQENFCKQTKAQCEALTKEFMKLSADLRMEVDSVKAMTELKKLMQMVPVRVSAKQDELDTAMKGFDVLFEYGYRMPKELFSVKWKTYSWPLNLHRQIKEIEKKLQKDKDNFITDLRQRQEIFESEYTNVETQIESFHTLIKLDQFKSIAARAKDVSEKLSDFMDRTRDFNSKERMMKLKLTDYLKVKQLQKRFQPYDDLWATTNEWKACEKAWYLGPFMKLDPEKVQELHTRFEKTMKKCMKQKAIKENDGLSEIAGQIQTEIKKFKPLIPIVTNLRHPGMRDRHWTKLSNDLDIKLTPDDSIKMTDLTDNFKLHEHIDEIIELGETCVKEYSIEISLKTMKEAWVGVNFQLGPHEAANTFILKDVEDITNQLDEHVVQTQAMQFSSFKKVFEEEIQEWNDKLRMATDVIEQWLILQRNWMSLQPIFASPDIRKQLPREDKKFSGVNKLWRLTMSQVKASPAVLDFCNNQQLKDKMTNANVTLDEVQKALAQYLNTKRAAFARFYFLSDDELLGILSKVRDPTKVQPFISKVFENIAKLEFAKKNYTILGMYSAKGELVKFVEPIDPRDREVEDWLSEVRDQMRATMRYRFKKAIMDYKDRKRNDWIARVGHPGQCVLQGSQVRWTMEVEEAFDSGGAKGLENYFQLLNKQLMGTVALAREKLSKLVRKILGPLIVLDVHAKDVVEGMVEEKCEAKIDFPWIRQMRYYLQSKNPMADDQEEENGQIMVEMTKSRFPMCYEYIGNSGRLVITPLTDRCYMTLMTALQLHLGGAPAGPAGTGKTETVKDLAKACAKFCVVFNCSDGMDCKMTGKFFRGLAMAGAWACFDEFNRINIEVLSVVAQQVSSIWGAIRSKLKTFNFEDTMISLDPTCCAFITMNPGYAGRTELPDNLAALFRPVAMMVPDYAMIAEIMLYSFGFENAKPLSKKMVSTFTLCSEQLSSQFHYDYGMRAVFSVIIRAGLLKGMKPKEDEGILVLSALIDVNAPKFLPQDLPLFDGIISDLFPGLSKPKIDYTELMEKMVETCSEMELQPVEAFTSKCIQLYETTVVRHGLMIVGPTGGGKTSIARCLSRSLSKLEEHEDYFRVDVKVLNPKAITMGQLYGENDPVTTEWTDGILAKIIRQCVEEVEDEHKKWVMFDGPVDAIWIENMNTVLDDNKKLCLVSGEILALTPHMRMIFEVEDLSVASPATVSRCGMVYLEPSALGLKPLVRSYVQSFGRKNELLKPLEAPLQKLFDDFIDEAVDFMRRNLDEPVPSTNSAQCKSTMAIIDSFFLPYCPTVDGKTLVKPEEVAHLVKNVGSVFIQALVWGVGGTTTQKGREKFEGWLHKRMDEVKFTSGPERDMSIYDYTFNLREGKWEGWMAREKKFEIKRDTEYSQIVVPTVDSVRYSRLLAMLVNNKTHVLFTGDTGTGKTVNVNQYLAGPLMKEEFSPINIIFSAATSANQVDDFLTEKLEKRRTAVYGPPLGKRFVIFVDDMNMPMREEYFAQPPIEFLRQWMDHGGWYYRADQRTLPFIQVLDIGFIGAMGPPGGGRQPVTARFLRHFTQIAHTQLVDASKRAIFGTICRERLADFSKEIKSNVGKMVDSTIELYNTIAKDLLPTPEKSHYTFNLRDLSKVFQGVLQASSIKTNKLDQFVRLWVHECRRVFGDRLINDQDRKWLDDTMGDIMKRQMNKEWDAVMIYERLICGDFLGGPDGGDGRIYEEAADLKTCRKTLEEYLELYNEESKAPMKLVLFLDAIEHVSRISRVIRQPGGNCLLLGVGGSGRSSLTRLATFMAEYDIYQIEIAKGYNKDKWHENLKEMFMTKALKNIPTVFLYSDTQILEESMLEDVNNILNSGEVPSLIQKEDMEDIYKECKNDCLDKDIEPTPLNVYTQFILRVKKNIHVCMCMSPGSEEFRTRLRMFPSLVNCCTIDWFSAWPAEALASVGKQKVEESNLDFKEVNTGQLVNMFQYIHLSVEKKSVEYREKLRRVNYVTPTSYLELLTVYKELLTMKRKEVGSKRDKLQNGLDKLADAEKQVAQLEIDLKAKQPVLAKTLEEVKQTSEVVAKEKAAADITKGKVEKQASEAKVKADECKAIEDDAQKDLDEALPLLSAAVQILNSLKESDITTLKSYNKPPAPVKLTMEAMCIMLEKKPAYVKDDNGKKVKDYWGVAKKESLANPRKFVQDLVKFDKDNIKEKVIKQIGPYVKDEKFAPAVIKNASAACEAVCKWVHAMYKYHFVLKEVEPKKQKLAKAQAEFKVVDAALKKAQAQLQEVLDALQKLEDKLTGLQNKKKELNDDVKMCQIKLVRADKLIGGLGGEKKRWAETVKALNESYKHLAGDVMISAGAVSYLGAFVAEYRRDVMDQWRVQLKENKVPFTDTASVVSTLGDPVQIRKWNVCGLPTDEVSVENGIIMDKARRWPLLIDPQEQASNFIKKLGASLFPEDGIKTVKMTDKTFARVMENAIRMGRWVLIESVQETLDPMLDPILGKQVFTAGGIKSIRLGDNTIPWMDSFRLYMSSKLPNPHYAPELQVKITLLNFTITPTGLEDQMLNNVVAKEQPELQVKKVNLIKQMAKAKNQLQAIEDQILDLLKNSEGDILADEELIKTLDNSKKTSKEIKEQLKEAVVVEKEIDDGRSQYKPVAVRASILYFCIADLAKIDPMYQYSLEWFSKLFEQGISNSQPSDEIKQRLANLNDYFTLSLYENICRSLFEKHKLLFSLLLTIRILSGAKKVNLQDWRFLVTGAPPTKKIENPCPEWLKPNVWMDLLALSDLETFTGLEKILDNEEGKRIFKVISEHDTPHEVELPAPWNTKLDLFQKMIIVKVMRPDKMTGTIQNFVMHQKETGKAFVEPPNFSLVKSFSASRPQTPMVFVLSVGADPAKMLEEFAESKGMKETMRSISLGQGQGPKAEKFISEGIKKGSWVLLQNCHLAISWLPSLEKICEDLKEQDVDPNFRLWLTSLPSPKFPVSVLQNGVKMTMEPPKGLRANLRGSYLTFNEEVLTNSKKPEKFQKLLYGLCFFHANILARREYGPLGWNIPYAFTQEDLDVSVTQLRDFLDMYDKIPYKVLNYLTYDINYGGRVTDDKDRRTIATILEDFLCPETLNTGHSFSKSGLYLSPAAGDMEHYLNHIKTLPLLPKPEAFGMHANAEITSAQAATTTLFRTILELLPRQAAGGGKSREELIYEQAESILKKVPKQFDMEALQKKFPLRLDESMNTVLAQETMRYNRLLGVMTENLENLMKALKGYVVMSTELEAMANSLFANLVPEMWKPNVGFTSLMPLASWTVDLSRRCEFFSEWVATGTPKVFWISGFFFPQAFLTGAKQNYARKYVKAIDGVSFGFKILKEEWKEIKEGPEDGCYIRGLFMEGARWDAKEHSIVDSRPKELFTKMAVMWLVPEFERKPTQGGVYRCPIYKTLTRAGTLSTTGHSTNFVLWVEIPTKEEERKWIKAGVALFTGLKYVAD
uniref:AAA+ ATPase domain-containing protein n=1 Tax=Lotharella globosa TaxID=91324 RepID=A0A7S3ZAX1_9EUKA